MPAANANLFGDLRLKHQKLILNITASCVNVRGQWNVKPSSVFIKNIAIERQYDLDS